MSHSAQPTMTHKVDDHHLIEENQKYFTFNAVAMALAFITMIELVIVYLPIAGWIVFTILTVLSVVKFAAVCWWFMHLRWDKILLTLLFCLGLLLAGGTVIALFFLFQQDPNGAPTF
ncbi:MAG: cytochrome C oxidase subunit IV family protein [Verrucomicrobiota bacterium JB022]|nr:cytochrome C oxidase subunit IV family protein [Verrucomicrobiota bacterium JB022]